MRTVGIANGLDLVAPEVSLGEVLGLMGFFEEVFVPFGDLNYPTLLAVRDGNERESHYPKSGSSRQC